MNIDKTKSLLVNTLSSKYLWIKRKSIGPGHWHRCMHVHEYLAIGVHIDGKLKNGNHIYNVWKKIQQKHDILKKQDRHIMQL